MSNRSETFGRLIKGAINSIAAYEGKTAPAVEEELGAQIGLTGAAVQRYKAGYLPPEPRTIAILAEAAVRRGYLSRAWLARFLQAARYPNPDALAAQLADVPAPAGGAHESRLPSGTLAFLFTDIEGSTTLWEQHAEAMERALARHDAIMSQTIDAYGGHVFKTVGDAFYAVFTTAVDALDAILAAQRAIGAETWGAIGPLRVRAGLHVGAAQQRDGDYFGQPLNRVARLCAAGHGGQILLSNAAQELTRDALPKGAALRDLGEHRLKDLARPERVFQVVAPDLLAEFPPLRTLDNYRHNLPAQPTPLIGREDVVLSVRDMVRRSDTRLLTLTGPGGIGKTRLALQAAAELLDDFRDGVFFIPLAPIRDPQLVATSIAQALGVKEMADRPLDEQLKVYLREKQMLLLLDNFEQVAAAAPLIAELLAAAPELKVLATTREVLHLYGEHEYAVPPLSLPDMRRLPPIERLTQYEAVRLFIERAQAVRPDFTVTADNAPAVAEICARLDGLPLAIELAAARSKLFPPKALLARLDKRLSMLIGGPRDLPARQQTLRGAIAWSYDLLDAAEQALFARLGVFAGGCTLAAAEAVLGDDGRSDAEVSVFIRSDAVLDGLTSLMDKSLLKQSEGADGEPRFVMLETIREYALERLEESGEADAARRRHAEYYLAFAEHAAPQLYGPAQGMLLERLEREHDNLRAALVWSQVEGNGQVELRLASALGRFWYVRGYFAEGRHWLEEGLARSPDAPADVRVHALNWAAEFAPIQKDTAAARAYYEEMHALCRKVGNTSGLASALYGQAWLLLDLGDYPAAQMCAMESVSILRGTSEIWGLAFATFTYAFVADALGDEAMAHTNAQESVALFRSAGDSWNLAGSLSILGNLARRQGDFAAARAYYEEGLALWKKMGDKPGMAWGLRSLGALTQAQGKYTQAARLWAESLAIVQELGHDSNITRCLEGAGKAATGQGQHARAARLLGAAEILRDASGVSIPPVDRADYDRTIAAIRAQLDEDTFAAAWAAGRELTLEQAVAEAVAISD